MKRPTRPLTKRNFSFHLNKASSLLKNALNREALHTLSPWQGFLDYLKNTLDFCDYAGVAMFRRDFQCTMIDPIAITWPEEITRVFLERNLDQDPVVITTKQGVYRNLGRCFSAMEIMNPKEYSRTSFYNDFAKPYHVENQAQIFFPLGSTQLGALSIFKPSGVKHEMSIEKEFLAGLSEDVGMALNHRHLLQRLQATKGALNRFKVGVILLNEQGLVETFNESAKNILDMRDPLLISHNRLYTTEPGNTERLNDLCYRMLRGETRQREHQIILNNSKGKPALQILAMSLDDKLSETITGSYVPIALFLNDPMSWDYLNCDQINIFREFYGCGERQAQVGNLYSQGLSETEIAQKLNINKETVRSHLNQVSEKLKNHHHFSVSRKKNFWDISQKHQWPIQKSR